MSDQKPKAPRSTILRQMIAELRALQEEKDQKFAAYALLMTIELFERNKLK
jgi:hypothetical protein